VIATAGGRDTLRACLASLARQTAPRDSFEVVVIDAGGAHVGDAGPAPHALRVLARPGIGAAAARNAGAEAAAAARLLFLDDGVIAAGNLVAEHLAAHERAPAAWIQGALTVTASTPAGAWAARRERRLSARPTGLAPRDVVSGNASAPRAAVLEAGGFDAAIEDRDLAAGLLAHRLERRGAELIYCAGAVATRADAPALEPCLGAAFERGRSQVALSGADPSAIWALSWLAGSGGSRLRPLVLRRIRAGPTAGRPAAALARAARAAHALGARALAAELVAAAIELEFARGLAAAAGADLARHIPRGVPVLCYHHVSDVRRPRYRTYVLPPRRFARQVRYLTGRGYEAITLDRLHAYLTTGVALPARPVVVTFDDGYAELAATAVPVLARAGYAHAHFINSAHLGGRTTWIRGAADLPVLSASDLRALIATHGERIDFQAHGASHASLPTLPAAELARDIEDCIDALGRATGRPVRDLAYPFGHCDAHARDVVRRLPVRLAFTVDPGLCRPGQDPHGLPRIELFRSDTLLDLRIKLRFGRGPTTALRRYPFRRRLREWLGW